MGHKQGHVTEHMELIRRESSRESEPRSSCVSRVSSIVKTSCLPLRIEVAFLHFVYVWANSPNVYRSFSPSRNKNIIEKLVVNEVKKIGYYRSEVKK